MSFKVGDVLTSRGCIYDIVGHKTDGVLVRKRGGEHKDSENMFIEYWMLIAYFRQLTPLELALL